jgi:hypothetical protein
MTFYAEGIKLEDKVRLPLIAINRSTNKVDSLKSGGKAAV